MTQPAHIAPASQSVEGMYADYFLDYASYVILERAVPKINDGFNLCSAVFCTPWTAWTTGVIIKWLISWETR